MSISQVQEKYLLKYNYLVMHKIISREGLTEIIDKSISSSVSVEDLLLDSKIPKYEILQCLSNYWDLPFIEYDDSYIVNNQMIQEMDLDYFKKNLFFPISIRQNTATVVCYNPVNCEISSYLNKKLGINEIHKIVALPSDIIQIIENNHDVIPNCPPSAARTPLARTRTHLANIRAALSGMRTSLAEGRTGLAFIRTGFSFLAISFVAYRIFGVGYLLIPEALLSILGLIAILDGFRWYVPAGEVARSLPSYYFPEPSDEVTVLEVEKRDDKPVFKHIGPIDGASELRSEWNRLSPVMKRRFLALDRTDLAEERTKLAFLRTVMAASRTGLAFARTGIAFIGLGVAFLRHFHIGDWTIFDIALIAIGVLMSLEGLYWHIPGVKACQAGARSIDRSRQKTSDGKNEKISFWRYIFPLYQQSLIPSEFPPIASLDGTHPSGIWGTTGLALERTLNSERRNVMARLRTVMATSRTGLAFIRTGARIFSVGLGLLVYFGVSNSIWSAFYIVLMLIGLFFLGIGFYWHIPAERIRDQFPYCYSDMEIVMPDYGHPTSLWRKIVFSYEDI